VANTLLLLVENCLTARQGCWLIESWCQCGTATPSVRLRGEQGEAGEERSPAAGHSETGIRFGERLECSPNVPDYHLTILALPGVQNPSIESQEAEASVFGRGVIDSRTRLWHTR